MESAMNNLLHEDTEILTYDSYSTVSELYDLLLTRPIIILPSYNTKTKNIELDVCRKIDKVETTGNQYYVYIDEEPVKLYEDHNVYIMNEGDNSHAKHSIILPAKSLLNNNRIAGFNKTYDILKIIKYTFKQPGYGYRVHTEKNNNFYATKNNILL